MLKPPSIYPINIPYLIPTNSYDKRILLFLGKHCLTNIRDYGIKKESLAWII
jgi:hypothetical protein